MPISSSAPITLDNPILQRAQRSYALATIIMPLLGTVAAIVLMCFHPITAIDIGLLVFMYVLTSVGITVGFHRYFSHRSFEAHPALEVALGIMGSMAAQGSIVYWAATHRRHHTYSEQADDPHSPYVHDGKTLGFLRGFWHSHIGWMLASQMTNTARFARDLIKRPLIARINAMYSVWVMAGVLLPACLGGLLSQTWMGALTGFLWGGMVRLCLVHHMMWTSGSTAHMFGLRHFNTNDNSTNNPVLALANLGEAWHNNHHAFPYSAMFGLKWWQIDMGGCFIRTAQALGLARNVRRPSPDQILHRQKESVDNVYRKVDKLEFCAPAIFRRIFPAPRPLENSRPEGITTDA